MDNTARRSDDELLEAWLTDVAELSGKKLAACLKGCEEALIENIDDLRRLYKSSGGLREFLPFAVASRVAEALEKSPAEIANTSKSNQHSKRETTKAKAKIDNSQRPKQLSSF